MKLSLSTRQRADKTLGPLIDVVFLLLLFFMLAGTLTPPKPLPVRPPVSRYANHQAGENGNTILLAADGRLAFAGRELDRAALREALVERVREEPGLEIELKADAEVEAETLLELLKLIRAAGVDYARLIMEVVAR